MREWINVLIFIILITNLVMASVLFWMWLSKQILY